MTMIPFAKRPTSEKVKIIGDETIGVIHLSQRGYITPNENPTDFQDITRKQAEFFFLVGKAADRLAKEKGIARSEAQKRLFGSQLKAADESAATIDSDQVNFYDYLEADEFTRFLELQANKPDAAAIAATLVLRYRILYPVTVASDVDPENTIIPIDAIGFDLLPETQIAFSNGVRVKILSPSGVGATEVATTGVPRHIPGGTIGYVINSSGDRMVGCSSWTIDQTKELLPEPLIQELQVFHQHESAGVSDDVVPEGNSLNGTQTNSSDSVPDLSSTGGNSIAESNASESPTQSSVLNDSEIAQIS